MIILSSVSADDIPSGEGDPLLVAARYGVVLPTLKPEMGPGLAALKPGTNYLLRIKADSAAADGHFVEVKSEFGKRLGTFPREAFQENMFERKIAYESGCGASQFNVFF